MKEITKQDVSGSRYLTLIQEDEGGGYNVSFPDFPGCFTCGDTYEEAVKNAVEALSLWLEGTNEYSYMSHKNYKSNLPIITFTTPQMA